MLARVAQHLGQARGRVKADLVYANAAWLVGMVVARGAGPLRAQVLKERTPAHDVQHLHTAADAKHGHRSLDRPPRQRDLRLVALGLRCAALGQWLLAIKPGIDIAAAGQQQAIQPVTDSRHAGAVLERRNQQRRAARPLDGADVRLIIAIDGAERPRALGGEAGDADQWPHVFVLPLIRVIVGDAREWLGRRRRTSDALVRERRGALWILHRGVYGHGGCAGQPGDEQKQHNVRNHLR